MVRPHITTRLISFIFAAFLCMIPAFALAQSPLQTAAELSNGALEDYDNFELDSADANIMQAAHILEQNAITDAVAAKIYIAQGIISYGRFKDSAPAIADERAFAAFLNALSVDPNAEIPSDYKSPEIVEVFERAKATIDAAPKSSAAMLTAVKPSVEHKVISSSNRCEPILIRATVPAHPDIYRVYLYYATDDQHGYTQTELHPTLESSDILTYEIPAIETRGNKMFYYIEAQNRTGDIVANVANANNPQTAVLVGECTGLSREDVDKTYGEPLFQLSVMGGTGGGYINGKVVNCAGAGSCKNSEGNINYNPKMSGMAILPFHIRANGMFNLPHHFQIGFYIRGQLANLVSSKINTTAKHDNENLKNFPEQYNLMLGLALRYLILWEQPYRLYVGLEVGWGGANASVALGSGFNDFWDIYLYDGPVHVAPEIGFLWSLHKNVGLVVELAIPVHFPNEPAFHFDFSVGPFFQF